MKKLITLIATLGLTVSAFAADTLRVDGTTAPSGNIHALLTTNTGPILIAGSFTTNLPATAAVILPVPKDGWGVYLRTGGTNASDTTNLVIVLEGVVFPTGSIGGGTQVVDNATITISTPTTATGLPTGYDDLTNFANLATAGNVFQRCDGIRVRSIQNTNLNSIWISNLFQIRSP